MSKNNPFQPKKTPRLNDRRQGDRTSFLIRKKRDIFPKDPCGDLDTNAIIDLQIGKGRGRQDGAVILYDPVQQKNYLSQYARYERSLKLYPDSIIREGNELVYQFCSSDSSTGYWEVRVGANATFLELTNPVLYIICPRPFQLTEFTEVLTDGSFILWEQLQGRIAIISPTTGEGSLDPLISIIGTPSEDEPPILIKGDADGDPGITDTLLIYTRPTSDYEGLGAGIARPVVDPCFYPTIDFAPISPPGAFCYDGRPLEVTLTAPNCDGDFAIKYELLSNTTGGYLVVETTTPENPFLTVSGDIYYKIRTTFKFDCRLYSSTSSTFFFLTNSPDSGLVFADEEFESKVAAAVSFASLEKVDLRLKLVNDNNPDDYEKVAAVVSFASLEKVDLRLKLVNDNNPDDYEKVAAAVSFASLEKIDIGGIIIG